MDVNELKHRANPPFDLGPESLFVAYFSSAEWGCFATLGWQMPARVLDLWCEFKCLTNGRQAVAGLGLIGALTHFGLSSIEVGEKETMRELAMRGGPYSDQEMECLLDYCQSDVDGVERLLARMLADIDLPRALLRGRYMIAVARIEYQGIPIDCKTLTDIRRHWDAMKDDLIGNVDQDYGVYEGTTFKSSRFEHYLGLSNIPWPRRDSGALALDDATFKEQANRWPQLRSLRELRHALSGLKLESLAIGRDGRNRTLLSPFRSRTGRNQPSNSKFIFGPSVWLRGLIKPEPSRALAYVDWSQQELGIAAALSGDAALIRAYRSGDPYLEFAKFAGAAPPSATKESHAEVRSAFKICMLATQYGMSEYGLALKLGQSISAARNLLRAHRETFPAFWRWSQDRIDRAMATGKLSTVFGWTIHTVGGDNPRSLGNFTMQGNGAEMLRLACCSLTESSVQVCCPVHDAILIEGPSDSIEEVVATTRRHMRDASSIVLNGFPLDSDVKIVRSPERYMDEERGRPMWERIMALVHKRRTGSD